MPFTTNCVGRFQSRGEIMETTEKQGKGLCTHQLTRWVGERWELRCTIEQLQQYGGEYEVRKWGEKLAVFVPA